jgi:2-methylisocitrate lyase-like PEP mutase family enzyme
VIFVESPESEDEMLQVASEVDAPLFANMVPGGRTPILGAARLSEMGYAIGIHPAVGFLASAAALTQAYADLKDNGQSTEAAGLMDFGEMNDLMGFQDIWAFEKAWAQE